MDELVPGKRDDNENDGWDLTGKKSGDRQERIYLNLAGEPVRESFPLLAQLLASH